MTPPPRNFTSTSPPVRSLISAAAARMSRIHADPSGVTVAILSVWAASGAAASRAASARNARRRETDSEIVIGGTQ